MADVMHGFNYFVWFGTAARPDHATVPRLESIYLTRASCDGIIFTIRNQFHPSDTFGGTVYKERSYCCVCSCLFF